MHAVIRLMKYKLNCYDYLQNWGVTVLNSRHTYVFTKHK
jgi:hypothetical protein